MVRAVLRGQHEAAVPAVAQVVAPFAVVGLQDGRVPVARVCLGAVDHRS